MTKRGGEDSGGNGGCRFRAVAGTLQVSLSYNDAARVDVARRRERRNRASMTSRTSKSKENIWGGRGINKLLKTRSYSPLFYRT